MQPLPGRYLETARHSSAGSTASPVRYAVYDIADIVGNRRVLNVDVKHEVRPRLAHITPSTLTAHRFQTGLLGFQGFILLFVLLKHLQWPAGSGDTVAWWTHSVSLMSDYLISFSLIHSHSSVQTNQTEYCRRCEL